MFNLKGFFSNKHRAYLLIFAISFLLLRLPLLITNKIERVIASKLAEVSQGTGTEFHYEALSVSFPATVKLPNLTILAKNKVPFTVTNLIMTPKIGYPINVEVKGEVFRGATTCKISSRLFSSELGLDCGANNIELIDVPQLKDLNLNGPLSFKFSGTADPKKNLFDINGEFLSQVDTGKLVPPKALPSFIKLPNFGLLDLKGAFELKGDQLNLKDTSLISSMGDVNASITSKLSPNFYDVLDLDSTLKVKLTPAGMQSIAPWIGLALGGVQYPSSGEANILIKGNSKTGFKAKLGS